MIGDYVKSYDMAYDAWPKRADATNFATYLAAELQLNPKAVQVDKDGKMYRVHIPLISAYWAPKSAWVGDWESHLGDVKTKVSKWATA